MLCEEDSAQYVLQKLRPSTSFREEAPSTHGPLPDNLDHAIYGIVTLRQYGSVLRIPGYNLRDDSADGPALRLDFLLAYRIDDADGVLRRRLEPQARSVFIAGAWRVEDNGDGPAHDAVEECPPRRGVSSGLDREGVLQVHLDEALATHRVGIVDVAAQGLGAALYHLFPQRRLAVVFLAGEKDCRREPADLRDHLHPPIELRPPAWVEEGWVPDAERLCVRVRRLERDELGHLPERIGEPREAVERVVTGSSRLKLRRRLENDYEVLAPV
eukprot:scaffold3022_cov150-Pinguiococcus_pyrenoidosus.AAC.4